MGRRIPAARPAGPANSFGDGGVRFVAFSPDMPTDAFEEARALQQAGDLAGAASLYVAVADADPSHFRALHNLGVVLEAQGERCAESAYERSLAANPDSAWTHYNLARLRHLGGESAAAERGYRRALELDDELTEAYFNLGRLLLERGDAGEAEIALLETVRRTPGAAGAQSYLGDALFAQRRTREALEAYRRTVELEPGSAVAQFDVGKSFEYLKRFDEAIDCYRRSVVLEPNSGAAREGLARALDAAGRHDEAVSSVHEWLSLAPGNAVASHLLASLGAVEAPERASDGYVRETFDRFAADFDTTLARLEYRAPELITAIVALSLGEPAAALDVLDAGCGTGLCAPLLRPWARRLEGVDLSGAMLERARRRGGYDALHEAELTAFLRGYTWSWDVIASADTLCYFGALEPVLRAAANALRAGGTLAFTLERSAAGGTFALQPHGRYAHDEGYVRAALDACGYEVTLAHGALRREGGRDVEGLIVAARTAVTAGPA